MRRCVLLLSLPAGLLLVRRGDAAGVRVVLPRCCSLLVWHLAGERVAWWPALCAARSWQAGGVLWRQGYACGAHVVHMHGNSVYSSLDLCCNCPLWSHVARYPSLTPTSLAPRRKAIATVSTRSSTLQGSMDP